MLLRRDLPGWSLFSQGDDFFQGFKADALVAGIRLVMVGLAGKDLPGNPLRKGLARNVLAKMPALPAEWSWHVS
jgi:hypothetical protein